MRRLLLVVAALALVVPAQAMAKEPKELRVCGPASCGVTQDRALLANVGDGGNGARVATPGLRPYYKLKFILDVPDDAATESFEIYYLPDLGVIASPDELGRVRWTPVTREFRTLVTRLSQGVQPYGKPTITKVKIGSRVVSAPATYERLLTIRGKPARRVAHDWRYVSITTDQPSPWSDWQLLKFSAKRGYLYRDQHSLVLPKYVAAQVKAGRTLGSAGSGLAAAAVLGAFGLVFLRRRARR